MQHQRNGFNAGKCDQSNGNGFFLRGRHGIGRGPAVNQRHDLVREADVPEARSITLISSFPDLAQEVCPGLLELNPSSLTALILPSRTVPSITRTSSSEPTCARAGNVSRSSKAGSTSIGALRLGGTAKSADSTRR